MTSLLVLTTCLAAAVTALTASGWAWRAFTAYGQHAGGGEGALTVWQLIAHVEEERQQREHQGRHRLREPEPPLARQRDPAIPPLELQRRALDSLYRI
ncbi:hypothetical protein [Saccharopolyspora sp. ASAGF58]|uniref:hypothetical protein n=1 Tax=Saccharopolyspora sp. ASAGF58 TaxID=2719023 RepID=UPI00144009CD|nr:hypothetical protein [Saccharopolyspora sp. ASAGF58]QIZ34921.1 hypothetical protein FDZ84_09530 [Saccharopolyspora sp. ASAGF58]